MVGVLLNRMPVSSSNYYYYYHYQYSYEHDQVSAGGRNVSSPDRNNGRGRRSILSRKNSSQHSAG